MNNTSVGKSSGVLLGLVVFVGALTIFAISVGSAFGLNLSNGNIVSCVQDLFFIFAQKIIGPVLRSIYYFFLYAYKPVCLILIANFIRSLALKKYSSKTKVSSLIYRLFYMAFYTLLISAFIFAYSTFSKVVNASMNGGSGSIFVAISTVLISFVIILISFGAGISDNKYR